MTKNRKKDKALMFALYVAVALSVVAVVVGFVLGSNSELNYKMEKELTVSISSFEELEKL